MKTGEILKDLDVEDEPIQGCVRIEGVLYAKELFKAWGVKGLDVGSWYRIESRDPDGAITILRVDNPRQAGEASQA
jgi:hypothetical protein